MKRFVYIVMLSFLFLQGCEKDEINYNEKYLGNWKFIKTYQTTTSDDEDSQIKTVYYGQISPGKQPSELYIEYGINENLICGTQASGNKKHNPNFKGFFKSDYECEFEIIQILDNQKQNISVIGFKQ